MSRNRHHNASNPGEPPEAPDLLRLGPCEVVLDSRATTWRVVDVRTGDIVVERTAGPNETDRLLDRIRAHHVGFMPDGSVRVIDTDADPAGEG